MNKNEMIKQIEQNVYFVHVFFRHFLKPPHLFIKKLNMLNISPSEIQMLFLVMDNGRCTMTELSRAMHIPKSNVTSIVAKLIELDCVERIYDPNDRRRIYVDITKTGKALLRKGQEGFEKAMADMIKNYPDEQITRLSKILEMMREMLEADPEYTGKRQR
ncbi:MAG: MarR family transcriptional regulator [Spirochaetes bacterium]|nr:MAG: MarR family transcriptional regulator [Spirochaetota bacterium]